MSELLSRQEISNNIKSVDTDSKQWAQYALFGSWTEKIYWKLMNVLFMIKVLIW